MKNARNVSYFGIIDRSSTRAWEFKLMHGQDVLSLDNVDIVVEVYTSQLSPRLHVYSIVSNDANTPVSDDGGEIRRNRGSWTLILSPSFLTKLDVGVLTFRVLYTADKFSCVNVITSGRLV